MNFLQFAVWGAYLISMGTYLFSAGMGDKIGYFYAMQGVVALFMPALMGIVADRWIPAQKLLAICHLLSAFFKAGMGYVAVSSLHVVDDYRKNPKAANMIIGMAMKQTGGAYSSSDIVEAVTRMIETRL